MAMFMVLRHARKRKEAPRNLAQIPLTPALSQREREPRRPACELFERLPLCGRAAEDSPSPFGRGQG